MSQTVGELGQKGGGECVIENYQRLVAGQDSRLDPEMLGTLAHEASAEEQYDDAVALMREHISHCPDDPDAFLFHGDYLLSSGRLAEALDAYRRHGAAPGRTAEATERCLRAIASSTEQAFGTPFVDPEALLEKARPWLDECLVRRADGISDRLCREWNSIRASSERRLDLLRTHYLSPGNGSDLQFIIMPMLMFHGGYPPCGVGALMAYLERKGFGSGLVDYNLDLHETIGGRWKQYWSAARTDHWRMRALWITGFGFALRQEMLGLAQLLAQTETRVFGLACFRVNRRAVLQLVPLLRSQLRPDQRLVLGGPDVAEAYRARRCYREALDHVDACVIGEGEQTLASLLDAWRHGDAPSMPGVLAAGNRDSFVKAPLLKAAELAGFPRYDPRYIRRIPEPRIHVLAPSRGCSQRCDFCSDHLLWEIYRHRDPKDVIEEIRYNVEVHGITRFHLSDSAVNISTALLEQFCDSIVAEGWKLRLNTSAMVSEQMTPELYRKMYRAGFRLLTFGIETGSPTVMKSMGKRGSISEATRNLRLSHEAGIRNSLFLLVGHPAETKDEFEKTVEFVRANRQYIDSINMIYLCYIIRNTALCKAMERKGIVLPEGWEQCVTWTDGDNDLHERLRRQRRLADIAAELSIPLGNYMGQQPSARSGGIFPAVRAWLRHLWGPIRDV